MIEMKISEDGKKGENEKWMFEITEIDVEIGGYVSVIDKTKSRGCTRTEIEFENIRAGITKLLNGKISKLNEINLIRKKSINYPKYLLEIIERQIICVYGQMNQEQTPQEVK